VGGRKAEGAEGNTAISALKFLKKYLLFFPVKVDWREGKALGSEVDRVATTTRRV
jgi:hypothetical protein